jgi:hypothetical protein
LAQSSYFTRPTTHLNANPGPILTKHKVPCPALGSGPLPRQAMVRSAVPSLEMAWTDPLTVTVSTVVTVQYGVVCGFGLQVVVMLCVLPWAAVINIPYVAFLWVR